MQHYSSFDFFQPFKNGKNILNLWLGKSRWQWAAFDLRAIPQFADPSTKTISRGLRAPT